MTRTEDEKEGWFLINDIKKEDLEGKEIVFKAQDLAEWFQDFDKWWLQIKNDKVCLSYEGVGYEPHFYGKIRRGEKG